MAISSSPGGLAHAEGDRVREQGRAGLPRVVWPISRYAARGQSIGGWLPAVRFIMRFSPGTGWPVDVRADALLQRWRYIAASGLIRG